MTEDDMTEGTAQEIQRFDFSKAPPENKLIIEYRPAEEPELAWVTQVLMFVTLTFGTGMTDPSRKTARMNNVNRILRRRSGVRNALAKAESIRALSHLVDY